MDCRPGAEIIPRIVLPYTNLRPEVVSALGEYPFEAFRMIGDYSYHYLLQTLWRSEDPVMICEHDIVIHDRVISEFAECPEDWCVFPYAYENDPETVALGCSRFSVDLMRATSGIFAEMRDLPIYNGHKPTHWCTLDGWLSYLLHLHGFKPHVHQPPVHHLNPTRSHDCRPTSGETP